MTPEWSKENGLDLLMQPVANTLFLWASSSSMRKRRLAMFYLRLFPTIKCYGLKYLQFDISNKVP